jgi:hypothetical protein
MVSPPGVGKITGWGDYRDALDGQPLFVTRLTASTDRKTQRDVKPNLSESTKPAIIEGREYFWSEQGVAASLLWRTDGEFESVGAYSDSGSILCLGNPTDAEVKAVIFQNYETPVKKWKGAKSLEGIIGWSLKGGYVLPQEIRESTILSGEASTEKSPEDFGDLGGVEEKMKLVDIDSQ